MTTSPPPDARNARIYAATANVAVMDILSGREHRRAAECFTTTTGWTLHQLRHTRIRELKDDNCSLPVLQKITGHRSLRTLTEHYPGPSPETVRASYENTDPDARRRRGSRALALPPTVFPALLEQRARLTSKLAAQDGSQAR